MKGKEKRQPISKHLASLPPLAGGQASAPEPAPPHHTPTPSPRMRAANQHSVAVATL